MIFDRLKERSGVGHDNDIPEDRECVPIGCGRIRPQKQILGERGGIRVPEQQGVERAGGELIS